MSTRKLTPSTNAITHGAGRRRRVEVVGVLGRLAADVDLRAAAGERPGQDVAAQVAHGRDRGIPDLVAADRYGGCPKDAGELASPARAPIVGELRGHRDRTQRGAADRLERALTLNGVEHDVKEYPDAGHWFLNDQPERRVQDAEGRRDRLSRDRRPRTHAGGSHPSSTPI